MPVKIDTGFLTFSAHPRYGLSVANQLKLVVFRDHQNARTFDISLSALSRKFWLFCLGIVTLLAALALSVGLGAHYFRLYQKSDPEKKAQLEQEVKDLNDYNEQLKKQIQGGFKLSPESKAEMFPWDSFVAEPIPQERLPIRVIDPQILWKDQELQFLSAIEYSRSDGGNQQGTFVLVAAGPQILLTYPSQAIQYDGEGPWLRPNGGEYFSVSRFRELKAQFPAVPNKTDIRKIHLYLFQKEGKILSHRVYDVR